MVGIKALVGIDGIVEVVSADVVVGNALLIGVVARLKLRGTLNRSRGERIVAHLVVVLRLAEVDLGSLWAKLKAGVEQRHCSRVAVGKLQSDSLMIHSVEERCGCEQRVGCHGQRVAIGCSLYVASRMYSGCYTACHRRRKSYNSG